MAKFSGLALAEAPSRMTILHPVEQTPLITPTGEEAWIDLMAAQSHAGSKHDRKIQDRYLRQRRRVTGSDAELATIEKLGALTVGWSLALLDGSPLVIECSAENATELYSDVRWLRDQVAAFVADLGNFPAAPLGTSSSTPSTSAS